MSDPDFKKFAELVRGVVKEELEPVIEKVTDVNEQVVYLTEKVDGEIIPTLENHSKYLKRISDSQEKGEDNIRKLDERLLETEAKLGIQAPPEFQIIK